MNRTPFDYIPSSELFYAAIREKDFAKASRHFQTVYDKMTSLAAAAKSEMLERKPAFFESPQKAPSDPEIPAHLVETYVITVGGHYWKWNCGWWEIDPQTRKTISKSPLGHQAFRRKPLALPNDVHFIRRPRPYGPWRRVVKSLMHHELWGNVNVEITDGIIAMITVPALLGEGGVELIPAQSKAVMLANLREIGVPLPPRIRKPATPKEKKVKEKKAKPMPQNILDLL